MEEDWLKSMEEQLARRGNPLQMQQPEQLQQHAKREEPKEELTPEEQSLIEKLGEILALPRETKKERLEEILDETLGGKGEFQRQYSLCPMESKEKQPDGYHIAYTKEGKAPLNPGIIPVIDAADVFNWTSMPCDYHILGMLTGAVARKKPYKVLTFNPSPEVLQSIKGSTSDYAIVSLEKPRTGFQAYLKPKNEQNIVSLVIYENDAAYSSEEEQEGIVRRLQEAENAVQLHGEGRISREELDILIRSRLKIKMLHEETEATYVLKNQANLEYINNLLFTVQAAIRADTHRRGRKGCQAAHNPNRAGKPAGGNTQG